MEKPSVVKAVDVYLEYYGKADMSAVQHVVDVLNKFEHLVDLATERAIDELVVPCDVIQMIRNSD